MKIDDLYSPFLKAFEKKGSVKSALGENQQLRALKKMAESWGENIENVQRWMASPEYAAQRALAKGFIGDAPSIVSKIEGAFGEKLQGVLQLSPSLMRFDGFARYDSGSHTVWFGVDHPDADKDYLKALLAHELSHVFRDHQPRVWAHLGKPLKKVSRDEYLEGMTNLEHIVSEGLATLFSQVLFPDVALHVHHYYVPQEMQWCLENFDAIEKAIVERLRAGQDVWVFYEEGAVTAGSPSRTQYFWGAKKIAGWLPEKFPGLALQEAVIEAHKLPSGEFDCFA